MMWLWIYLAIGLVVGAFVGGIAFSLTDSVADAVLTPFVFAALWLPALIWFVSSEAIAWHNRRIVDRESKKIFK